MTNKEQRRQEWTARVAAYQASGQTMKVWCHAQNVTKDQLKYWIRMLKSRPANTAKPSAAFVPLTLREPLGLETSASLILYVGAVRMEVRSGVDTHLLREVVAALAPSC